MEDGDDEDDEDEENEEDEEDEGEEEEDGEEEDEVEVDVDDDETIRVLEEGSREGNGPLGMIEGAWETKRGRAGEIVPWPGKYRE